MALAADPIKTGKMELIWLKPTARSPALMLCTESVWFWSSEQFAERATLATFICPLVYKVRKLSLIRILQKVVRWNSFGWNQRLAPQLLCCVQSQCGSEVPNDLLKGPPLATFICPLVCKVWKLSLIQLLQKVVRWNLFGWNRRLAPQLLCYVQSQCGSEVPNNLLKGPPWQLLFVLWFTRWENCPWYGSCKKLWDGIHLVETNGLLPSSYAVYRVSVVLKFQTICWKGRPWQLLFVLWLSLIQLLQNIA